MKNWVLKFSFFWNTLFFSFKNFISFTWRFRYVVQNSKDLPLSYQTSIWFMDFLLFKTLFSPIFVGWESMCSFQASLYLEMHSIYGVMLTRAYIKKNVSVWMNDELTCCIQISCPALGATVLRTLSQRTSVECTNVMQSTLDTLIRRLYDSTLLHRKCMRKQFTIGYLHARILFFNWHKSLLNKVYLCSALLVLFEFQTQYWVGIHSQGSSTKTINFMSANAKKRRSDKVHHICIITRHIKCIFKQDWTWKNFVCH